MSKTQEINGVNNSKDSAVLRELKETIRKQAAEIQSLRQELKGGSGKSKKETSSSKTQKQQDEGTTSGGAVDDLSSYLTAPFYVIAMKRVGWLSLFLVSLSLTAVIMNGFEDILAGQIELAYFVPLLAGHGGNTGGQAVGTVLSVMSGGMVSLKQGPGVVVKEALSGMMVGMILASLMAPLIHYGMGISLHVSTVIFFTVPLVSTVAATLGSLIPFVCVLMGLDPSVIAAPAMTSFVDVCGIASYFVIANYVFKYYGLEL